MRRPKLSTIKGSSAPGRRKRRRIFDCQGIFHYEFILGGKTAKKRRLHLHPLSFHGCVQKETLREMEKQQLVSSSRQCSSTPVGFVHGFLSKEQRDNTGAPLHSPDLATAEFYLFSRHKSALKGRRFCDATDIIKNAKDELKRLSQYGFQECFQQFYRRW